MVNRNKFLKIRNLAVLSVLIIPLAGNHEVSASVINDGFGGVHSTICATGGSSVGYGLETNNGLTWTSSSWRCRWAQEYKSYVGMTVPVGATGDHSNVPIGTPLDISKLDAVYGGFMNNSRAFLTKVEWDTDGDGAFDITDTGPWANGTNACCGTADLTQIDQSVVFSSAGTTTLKMRTTYSDSSTEELSGPITVVPDSVTAEINRIDVPTGVPNDLAPVLTGSSQRLSAARSASLSGFVTKYEWDMNGDGEFEIDGASTNTYTTKFETTGSKTVGVRVTSRGGSTNTDEMTIEVRQAPPAGEPGMSIKAVVAVGPRIQMR